MLHWLLGACCKKGNGIPIPLHWMTDDEYTDLVSLATVCNACTLRMMSWRSVFAKLIGTSDPMTVTFWY